MNESYQHDINKRVAAVLQGMIATVRLTNQRIESLETVLKNFAGYEEPPPIDQDRLQESMAASATAVDELERMFGLPDAAAGQTPSN
jgi:hypothetical protein